jgi:hypothetical protein
LPGPDPTSVSEKITRPANAVAAGQPVTAPSRGSISPSRVAPELGSLTISVTFSKRHVLDRVDDEALADACSFAASCAPGLRPESHPTCRMAGSDDGDRSPDHRLGAHARGIRRVYLNNNNPFSTISNAIAPATRGHAPRRRHNMEDDKQQRGDDQHPERVPA